jgi:hypothetical protein
MICMLSLESRSLIAEITTHLLKKKIDQGGVGLAARDRMTLSSLYVEERAGCP